MSNEPNLNWIANFLWGIADDVLRDLYVRGKYRDVILPMTVLQRIDAVLAPSKSDVLAMRASLDEMAVVNQEIALRKASGFAFYNTSKFSLKDLRNRGNQQQLRVDFEDWLNGFSTNVQDILQNFEFRNQIPRLSQADALGTLIEKFLDPELKLASLDNHAMGTVFEELVRRFNEDNNEEAGEHWTPRDVVKLMANLIFRPIADQITSGTYLLYDAAIGTGGMLTVAEQTLRQLASAAGKDVVTHLYGQEINKETYAICKADLLLSGEGEEADNIRGGPEFSTLSNDAFRGQTFDFMLSNPPYGKSWKTDLERMGGKKGMTDPRFIVNFDNDPEFSFVTRSSDGQMLFLANLVSKMKAETALGSRIAEIHNGSSLFTGDAGGGESNIRRYVIEQDMVEAIIQMPLNLFYNTGISTYIWVVTNRKPEHRKGKVQLIDASNWFTPLRKNLGAKNCELSPDNIELVIQTYLDFKETPNSKIFKNAAFGYKKIKIERPLRLRAQLTKERVDALRLASGDESYRREILDLFGDKVVTDFASIKPKIEELLEGEDDESGVSAKERKRLLDEKKWQRDYRLHDLGEKLMAKLGTERYDDFNQFAKDIDATLKGFGEKLTATDKKALLATLSWSDPEAPKVIKKTHKPGKLGANPLQGLFEVEVDGETLVVEYESDGNLSDFELVPLSEPGGVEAYVTREVLPYVPDAWVDTASEKIGYELSFTKYFYEPAELRPLTDIETDIRKLMVESDGLVQLILEGTTSE